jgi:maltooligosyltrehalose trehalohydrolase
LTTRHAFPLSFGAKLIAPDKTRFRLWAPSAETVSLELDGKDMLPMQPARHTGDSSGGWFEAELACGAGTQYRYVVQTANGELKVPDPASRAQGNDVHDASVVVDPHAYEWQHPEWKGRPWHESVLYELHPGALGGFEGIRQKLPELAALGITAVELMPVADFPGRHNWGYDGVLPFAPDTAYGTTEQLKQLIDTAHGLGMMVFLDVVYNHFGPDGNYLGAYAAPFFRDDIKTLWGQAIDFRKHEVREFFIENTLYWLMEYRFDGLRFDAVHAISEQDWLDELAQRVRQTVETDRHVHLVLEHDGNAASLLGGPEQKKFDAQWNDDFHHVMHVLLTGEREGYYVDYADETAARLARSLTEGFVYQNDPSPHRDGELRGESSAHLLPVSFVNFLQNHDQTGNRAFGDRLTTMAKPEALRAANALLLLSPQIPMLFMGEEIGATQPFLYFTSHGDPELANAVREGRRQEFAKFASFADPAKRAAIPDPNDEATFRNSIPNWEGAAQGDNASLNWLNRTARLLEIRHKHIVPRLPGTRAADAIVLGPAAVAAHWRMGDGSRLLLAINLAAEAVAVKLDALSNTGGADLLFETHGTLAALDAGQLPPFSFIALLEPAA